MMLGRRVMSSMILLVLSSILLVGCARRREDLNPRNIRKQEMMRMLDTYISKTKREVVDGLGPPDSIKQLVGYEIWSYHQSYGVSSTATGYVSSYGASYHGISHEMFDDFNLYFEEHGLRVIKYDLRF